MSPFNYKTIESVGEGGADAVTVCVQGVKESSATQNRGGPEWMTAAFLTFFVVTTQLVSLWV